MNIYTRAVPAALKEANSKMVNLVLPAQAACELNAPFSSLENLQLTVKKEILVGAAGIENCTIPPKAREQRRCHRSYRDNHYKHHKTASLQGRPWIFTFRRTEVAEFGHARTDLGVRLPWAQEVWSSNLHAPTNFFLNEPQLPDHSFVQVVLILDRAKRQSPMAIDSTGTSPRTADCLRVQRLLQIRGSPNRLVVTTCAFDGSQKDR